MFLREFWIRLPFGAVSYPRKTEFSTVPLWKPNNLVPFAAIWYKSTLTLKYTLFKSDKTHICMFLLRTSS
jgi:hypothetical protein